MSFQKRLLFAAVSATPPPPPSRRRQSARSLCDEVERRAERSPQIFTLLFNKAVNLFSPAYFITLPSNRLLLLPSPSPFLKDVFLLRNLLALSFVKLNFLFSFFFFNWFFRDFLYGFCVELFKKFKQCLHVDKLNVYYLL